MDPSWINHVFRSAAMLRTAVTLIHTVGMKANTTFLVERADYLLRFVRSSVQQSDCDGQHFENPALHCFMQS